jgi:beta-aspartyl-peptidase (threonine type)
MEIGGLGLAEAADKVIHTELAELGGQGGLVAVDRQGHIAMPFNTAGMFRGAWQEGGERTVAIW